MPKKRRLTKTGRYFEEKKPLASRPFELPPYNPDSGRIPFIRLHKTGPTEKIEISGADYAASIGPFVKQDAIFFLDTSIFSTCTIEPLWDIFLSRQVLITPMVWREIQPWIANPRKNQEIREVVLQSIRKQVDAAKNGADGLPKLRRNFVEDVPAFQILFCSNQFSKNGYDYYFRLLSLRKMMGPVIARGLEEKLGRPPTDDEFLAEVQPLFGERGFQFAKKGRDNFGSHNLLTDEQTVVMGVLTAILSGREIYFVTMDTDLPDQFGKLFLLIKEHYRAMLAANLYATDPDSMPFREVLVGNLASASNPWVGTSILQLRVPETEFDVLPQEFHSTVAHCILLGRDETSPRFSYSCFTIEKDTARVLSVKAATNGLSTDKFNGRNSTIRTRRFTSEQHEVVVSIGKEKTTHFEAWGRSGRMT